MNNKKKKALYDKEYRKLNLDKIKKLSKEYYLKNKEDINKRNRKNYEDSDKEKRRKYNKEYYKNNKSKILETTNKRYKSHNTKIHNQRMNKKYGITLRQYNELLKQQKNVCAICDEPETIKSYNKIKSLSIDHCHKTGKVRGLLCDSCNKGLGNFKDNIKFLQSAEKYLRRVNNGLQKTIRRSSGRNQSEEIRRS